MSLCQTMVEGQLMPNDITHPLLLKAFTQTPRTPFVAESLEGVAYTDSNVSMNDNRYLVSPLTLARLIQALEVHSTDWVLDVACGTGYSSLILSYLANHVTGLDEDAALLKRANIQASEQGAENVTFKQGDLTKGFKASGPYHAVLIAGGVDNVPQTVFDQLADGGRLATIKRHTQDHATGILYKKTGNHLSSRVLFDTMAPYLPGFQPQPSFDF